MKYRFIAPLHFMELEALKNKGTRIMYGARISNGRKILDETIGTKLMSATLGVHSLREFNDSVYVYIDNELDEIQTREQMDQAGSSLTFLHLRQMQHFTHELWKIKDNSVYVRDGFLLAYPSNGTFEDGCTYKASLSEVFTCSNCEIKPTKFSDVEVTKASEWYKSSKLLTHNAREDGGKLPDARPLIKGETPSTRMTRAIYFTDTARKNAVLPTKIVSYCTALECLFTTKAFKISTTVASRTANMLGGNDAAYISAFDLVKEAYKYRSIIVHGQSLEGDEETLARICRRLDIMLRTFIIGDHEIFSKDDKEMDRFFENLSKSLAEAATPSPI
ncbi:hypothetical protein [Priestia megaterium]|uniref:hypothetical protein n=1 Tax=Priestia megaterium TaxID=1404 RepID=UPI002B243E9E|nr:hypothetical protein [Priestia megaterium]MEB2294465.1 hypothetical protein [Priestia megaterium]